MPGINRSQLQDLLAAKGVEQAVIDAAVGLPDDVLAADEAEAKAKSEKEAAEKAAAKAKVDADAKVQEEADKAAADKKAADEAEAKAKSEKEAAEKAAADKPLDTPLQFDKAKAEKTLAEVQQHLAARDKADKARLSAEKAAEEARASAANEAERRAAAQKELEAERARSAVAVAETRFKAEIKVLGVRLGVVDEEVFEMLADKARAGTASHQTLDIGAWAKNLQETRQHLFAVPGTVGQGAKTGSVADPKPGDNSNKGKPVHEMNDAEFQEYKRKHGMR